MRVSFACIFAVAVILPIALALPSLASVGIDAGNVGDLLNPVGLIPSDSPVQAIETPTLLEVDATAAVPKKAEISDSDIANMMNDVMPALKDAQRENVDVLFSMDDTNPALDETILLETDTEVKASADTEADAEDADAPAAEGGAAGGKSYEAGNWGGPQVGPGGAYGAYWLGGGFAANNHPGPYIPGTPIFHPGANLNPFYYPRHAYRFNPYVPYSFGVGGPTYGPYYNGQPYLETGRFAPGPADAGAQVSTTTTVKNAFLETETDAEADSEAETEAPVDNSGDAVNLPYQVLKMKTTAAPEQPAAPAAETHIQAELQPKDKVFYDEYSAENGYDADIPKSWNKMLKAKLHPHSAFYAAPEYKTFPLPNDNTAEMSGDARTAAFDPKADLPQEDKGPAATMILPARMANIPVAAAGAKSLLEGAARAQAVAAQEQTIRLAKGQLHGLARKIAEMGQYEPEFSN